MKSLDIEALDELIALTEKAMGNSFAKQGLPNERQVKAEPPQDEEPDMEALASLYQE